MTDFIGEQKSAVEIQFHFTVRSSDGLKKQKFTLY